jgi:hypothetical protein
VGFVAHVSHKHAVSIFTVDHKVGGIKMIENFKCRHITVFRAAGNVNKDALTNCTAKLSFLAEKYGNKYTANNL